MVLSDPSHQPKNENSQELKENVVQEVKEEPKEQTKHDPPIKGETSNVQPTLIEILKEEKPSRIFSFLLSLIDEKFLIKRYFYIHILILSLLTLFFAVIIYIIERDFSKISFFDSIFMTSR